jgi:integrase
MALLMTRPTKHPRTGTYLVRLAIPPELRETTKSMFRVQAEFQENLRTKDPAEAKRRAPEALERLRSKLEQARNLAANLPQRPLPREIAALAGEWYRRRVGANGRTEEQDLHWDILMELASGDPELWSSDAVMDTAHAEALAKRLLDEHGFAIDPESVGRLTHAVVRAEAAFSDVLQRRVNGDWSPDTNLPKFPPLPPASSASGPALPGLTFHALLAGWALDRGWTVGTKPIPRALYDRERTLDRLAAFLGHQDADQVTKADAVRWKEDILKRGRASATVRNDISEMSAIWAWGLQNGKLRGDQNPFRGILPPKAKKKGREPRAFTDDEAARILKAAREEKGSLRWLPWVLCLTGARLNEICQSDGRDVMTRDGVPVIRIHDEGEGRTVKNADSRRTVPLHPALIAEGFLDYVDTLPSNSTIWPDIKPDTVFGLRSTTAGRKVSRWLRATLGITDPLISPNHSWRHWFIGACRKIVMPIEVRSAITGHSAKMDESAGYGDGMGTFVEVVAGYLAKVQAPL